MTARSSPAAKRERNLRKDALMPCLFLSKNRTRRIVNSNRIDAAKTVKEERLNVTDLETPERLTIVKSNGPGGNAINIKTYSLQI